eukprot:COSAG04_NODE_3415_length_2831_cov_8.177892_2_plen_206_part_00
MLQEEHQLHVRGIGVDGWDGTEEGTGSYENEEALEEIFSVFGSFVQATIRHRIADGKNTSWALVTMGDAESVDRALSAPSVMAGTNNLVLNRFSSKQAAASTGAMARVQKEALRGLSGAEVKALRLGKNLTAPAGLTGLAAMAWKRRAAKRRRALIKLRVVLAFAGARGLARSMAEPEPEPEPEHEPEPEPEPSASGGAEPPKGL